jgi:hypothetical protein
MPSKNCWKMTYHDPGQGVKILEHENRSILRNWSRVKALFLTHRPKVQSGLEVIERPLSGLSYFQIDVLVESFQ